MEIGLCHKINNCICLDQLQKGNSIILTGFKYDCPLDLKKWFIKQGFVKGLEISVHATSPFDDPVAYDIHHLVLVLRKDEAKYLQGIVL